MIQAYQDEEQSEPLLHQPIGTRVAVLPSHSPSPSPSSSTLLLHFSPHLGTEFINGFRRETPTFQCS